MWNAYDQAARNRYGFVADSLLEGRVRCELVSEFLESIKKGSF